MNKEFVMRGQTVSTAGQNTEVLNFRGYKPGYAYRLIELKLYPSTNIGDTSHELTASITAGKTSVDPTNPNFNDEGLIGTTMFNEHDDPRYLGGSWSVINDTFLITQDLILTVNDAGGSPYAVNWQCRFVAEKMNSAEEAVANFKQFTIFDD